MTRSLDHATRPSHSGTTKSLVIFLHGYGADGADLLGLADPLGEHLPDTAFAAPNAPERSVANPMGFQWFPLPWIDGSSEEESNAGMALAVADLNAFLDEVMEEHGVTPSETVLFGFSQGTMMSLHVAPRRDAPLAGIVAFSGRLMDAESLAEETRVRPPVLLVHGDADDVVPVQSLPAAAEALQTQAGKKSTPISRKALATASRRTGSACRWPSCGTCWATTSHTTVIPPQYTRDMWC